MLVADWAPGDPITKDFVRQKVEARTGVSPPEMVCAVVNASGKVESLICADPAIDTLPQKTLVERYSKDVVVGATFDSSSGLFSIGDRVIPAEETS